MFGKNLIKICERNIKTVSVIFAIASSLAATSAAQNINNDLQPKSTTATKTKPAAKSAKKSIKPAKSNPTPVSTAKSTNTNSLNTLPTETADQIINRYMNYSQSAGVTSRDWTNVLNQTKLGLKTNPANTTANAQMLIAQGQIYYNSGDYANALMQFNSAAQMMPNSALPFYCIGKVYLATRQPNEARISFEKALKINNNFALAYTGLGMVSQAQGNKGKAQDYFQQASKLGSPNNYSGNPNSAAGNSPAAPTPTNSPLSPFETSFKNAKALTTRKKWQDSLNILMPLTKSNQTPDLYIAVGDNYVGMQKWLSAQQAFQKAVELNPNSAAAVYKLGTVMFQMNEYQAASDAFEKALILDQSGTTINRQTVRKMADKAKELKSGKKRKFLGIGNIFR